MPTIHITARTAARLDLIAQLLHCSRADAVAHLVAEARTSVQPQTPVPDDKLLSLREASVRSGIPIAVLRRRATTGELPVFRVAGGNFWVWQRDVDALAQRGPETH